MKKWSAYLISMMGVFLLLIVLNIAVFACVALWTGNGDYIGGVESFSNGVSEQSGSYTASREVLERLDLHHAFAMLIDETGQIAWSYHKPDDVPDSYSLTDVATFSRWYLEDYPVYTRVREDGLFVVGYEKNSVWKYNLVFGQKTIKSEIFFLPYLIIANLLILVLLPAWITGRWTRDREKRRSEWIAGVSHDIRTPLSIVLGNAEKGSATEQQCLRIRELVNNLNTESKLETGTGKWSREPIKPAAIIRDVVIGYMNSNDDRYSFRVDIAPGLDDYVIHADEGLIRRMFENIISNSIRHNEDGCEILVIMKKYGSGRLEVIIRDNGAGTDETAVRKLNQRIKRDYLPEHGLGLRIVKQIAGKYRYRVTYRSSIGEGFETEIVM